MHAPACLQIFGLQTLLLCRFQGLIQMSTLSSDPIPLHCWTLKQSTCPAQRSLVQVSVNLHLRLRTCVPLCQAGVHAAITTWSTF